MAHITLIRPSRASARGSYSVIVAPPLGLAYVAAALEAAGHSVLAIDALGLAPDTHGPSAYPGLMAVGLPIDDTIDGIPADTDAIGISIMFSQEWPHVGALVRRIHARLPHLPIFLGGEHPTATWSYLLEHFPEVALCVLGEGDESVVDVAAWLDGRRDLASIPGIAYRDDGTPHRTAPRARVRQLDALPRPAWHLFPMEEYLERGLGHGVSRGRSIPMLATRGCPYQCTFCSSPDMWTTRYVTRPVDDVVDEIASYVERYGVTNIDFEDLTAIIKREWILSFCGALERRGLQISYQLPSGTRSEALDREVLEALYRTGCRNLTYAPESGSERTLTRIKKRVHLDRMLASMRTSVDVGIVTRVNMIIGFPFETRRDVWDTIRFCLRMAWIGVEDIPLFPFVPYPGSAIHADLVARGRLPEMNDEYFAALGYSNLKTVWSPCESMSAREITLYRTLGMIAFILATYLRRPSRLLRTARNLLAGRHDSAVEERLDQLLLRPLRRRFARGASRRKGTAPRGASFATSRRPVLSGSAGSR